MVKAFVVLHAGHEPPEALRRDLLAFARRLGAVIAPNAIEIVASVPKTRGGTIMGCPLRARE